jgi:uncharacterized membrane protein
MGDHDPETRPQSADVLPLDRLNAFSDGVFAIAITLLVLELSVPVGSGRLLSDLVEQWPEFLGYLISFAFIGGIWMSHARMTSLMKSGDTLVFALNILILLFVAVLPFTTNLMVSNLGGPDVAAAVLVYGANVLAASVLLSLLMLYLVRERTMLLDDVADQTLAVIVRQRWIAIAINVLALACAFVAPGLAVGLYVVVTVLLLIAPLVLLRRARGRSDPTTSGT